jgi:cellulose synthase/poly-beta-1,6-N-acetylglucosamine synthase-like glycosyltransferase
MSTVSLVLVILLAAFTSIYLLFLFIVSKGLARLRPRGPFSGTPFATVIVAARNEESTIGECLASLVRQTYPKDCHEIIVVDDGSTDRTKDIVKAFEAEAGNLRVLHTGGAGHKPRALTQGIEEARGSIILTTDADCIVRSEWISSMVARFDDATAFVAGPVVERPADNLIARLSRLEFIGLIGVAGGLIGAGVPIFCNGANIGFRKSVFREVGGYGSGHTSDDEALLQRVHRRRPGAIAFSVDQESIVTTAAPRSFSEFWVQRVRWSAKRRVYEQTSVLLIPVALYVFFVIFLISMAAAVNDSALLPYIAGAACFKILADVTVLHTTAHILQQQISWMSVFIAELLHVPYIVVAALQGQTGFFRWKGASNPS